MAQKRYIFFPCIFPAFHICMSAAHHCVESSSQVLILDVLAPTFAPIFLALISDPPFSKPKLPSVGIEM